MWCLPSCFTDVQGRGVSATDGDLIGLSFDVADGSVVRLALPYDQAESMALAVLAAGRDQRLRTSSQPSSSSGSPSAAVSPQEGMKV